MKGELWTMGIDNYKDPIISQWESSGGVKYSKPIVNEPHVVVGGMFALIGLPDVQARVQISGMVEIGFKDKVVDAIQFKVDYTNGYVFVHTSKEGTTINASYSSRGVNMYPASRIYTKVNSSGDVVETMSDWDSKFNSALENETIRITNENTRISNEDDRVTSESIRIISEQDRVSSEAIRKSDETERTNAEQLRIQAEIVRVQDELTRVSNEAERVELRLTLDTLKSQLESLENNITSSETIRVESENTRISNESARVSAEATRTASEDTRKSNEVARVNIETTRTNSEQIRITDENIRKTNESARIANEDLRKSSEINRIATESERVLAHNVRKQQVETATSNANAKIVEVESRFNALTSTQQGSSEVIDARKGKTSLKAKIDEFDEHFSNNMPHQIIDEDTGKKYRVGRRFKDGGMQTIWEEVI